MIMNLSIRNGLLWICLYFLRIQKAYFQSSDMKLCANHCFCVEVERTITCNEQDKVSRIPEIISMEYEKLTIQNGKFQNPYIGKHNLTGLKHLIYLKVIYCNLRGVESKAFENMKKLKYLDLSHNKIKSIEPYTFSGLNLEDLHLMENPGLKLSEKSFKEMTSTSINLRSNDIESIQFDIFSGTNFKKLYFFNNKIKTIDKKFSELFSRTDSIIDLTRNPLDCSCEMNWIVPILKEKYKNQNYVQEFMFSVNFTCETPLKLKGTEMKSLSIIDMPCPTAKITAITVALGVPDSELTCTAVGNIHRAPGVAWNYIEPGNVRELRRTPLIKSSNTTENLQTSLTVKVKITDKLQAFTCSSWLEESQTENIVVNIKAPLQSSPKPVVITTNTSTRSESKSKDIFRPFPEPHFIFKKQFTILEMIGAVIGTFIITLIILILLAQILRRWRCRRKTETNYKSVNIIKPYWTLGHDSNNTYSHPISHTEYDVPRTYDTDVPSMCQSPPLGRGEFLDYKTQNKIYSA